MVEAAGEVDAVFWQHSYRIDRSEITDEAAWFAATELMEAARLAFVNTAKRHVLGSADRLDRLPIRRPSGHMPGRYPVRAYGDDGSSVEGAFVAADRRLTGWRP